MEKPRLINRSTDVDIIISLSLSSSAAGGPLGGGPLIPPGGGIPLPMPLPRPGGGPRNPLGGPPIIPQR